MLLTYNSTLLLLADCPFPIARIVFLLPFLACCDSILTLNVVINLNRMASSHFCVLCAKGTKVAGGYSNRIRATKFNPTGNVRKYPNLQWAQLPVQIGGGRIKICTRCLKGNKHIQLAQ